MKTERTGSKFRGCQLQSVSSLSLAKYPRFCLEEQDHTSEKQNKIRSTFYNIGFICSQKAVDVRRNRVLRSPRLSKVLGQKKKKTVQELWEKQTRNENIRKYEQKKSNFLKKNQMDSRDEK